MIIIRLDQTILDFICNKDKESASVYVQYFS